MNKEEIISGLEGIMDELSDAPEINVRKMNIDDIDILNSIMVNVYKSVASLINEAKGV